jgi:hypothetical protein
VELSQDEILSSNLQPESETQDFSLGIILREYFQCYIFSVIFGIFLVLRFSMPFLMPFLDNFLEMVVAVT